MKVRHLHSPKMTLRWVFQCFLVFVIMLAFLFALGEVRDNVLITAIGTTSLGSSAFLAFVAHNSPMANNYRLLGGYAIAIIVGGFMHFIAHRVGSALPIQTTHAVWMLAAAATAITMMIMTLANLPHAPAAGLSLGMVLKFWGWHALAVIYLAALAIAIIKTVFRPWLVNLCSNKECEHCQ